MALVLLVRKSKRGNGKQLSLTKDPLLFAVLISIRCDFYPILV